MSQHISALELKRNKLMVDAQALLHAENVTSESRASAKAMLADVDVIENDLVDLRRIDTFNASQAEFTRSARPAVVDGGVNASASTPEQRKAKFNAAFRNYAVKGAGRLSQEERDLLTTSDATGAALIPQIFSGLLFDARKFYGPIATLVDQKVTDNNGAPMKISYSNDTANGMTVLATEGTSAPVETDPTFFSKILGVDTLCSGLVKVSFNELEDSSFDLDSFIRSKFAIRYARGLESIITLGKDSAGNVLANSTTGGIVTAATVAETTASLAAGIGWTDITKTFGALDAAYQNPATTKWVMNTNTRAYLLGLVDGFGRPFWTPDPSVDGPFSKLLGFDVVLNQAMANQGAANAIPILFGDLNSSYLLRTDGQPTILRLNERFADALEVGFYMYTRVGGVTKNAGVAPIVSLKQAAS